VIKHSVFSYSSNKYRIYGTYAFLFLKYRDGHTLKDNLRACLIIII
jgi:hypothetical protein